MPLSDVALLLGPIAFQNFEIPEHIGFGGEQRLALHDLPGGARVIDALGPAPADITWSGTFSGPDATLRARTLDVLRMQAAVLVLSWDVFFYSVVIRSFEARYHNAGWVPYRLRVSVLLDAAQVVSELADALLSNAVGDIASAFGFAASGGVDLGAVQTAIAAPGATVFQTSAYVAASAALASGRTSLQQGRDDADSAMASYAQTLDTADGVGDMVTQVGRAATLSASSAYLDRAAVNIQNASS